ncbi:myomegalin isoform X2 [Latimeria chalumnae]|uniref:myomegalin isoform X2 n=1 Tax=Latimeria chalumnae TaxID=7897 RepID=UPI0006D8F014|nr:PREDICTED: myomegalin isoform X2 [Latimeria chalumnae]|eukprot:XP_014351442.1 PREDICTED: myomegalin isoform X2 [Latimeria chalumnae]
MLDTKMKEACRICARELCGNQRRWIFHTASKLNLQVLLSHVLGKEVSRDGKAEFACSKCAFMLDRIYRFDTVIARIEALSIERLQKLLLEKERLKQCIAGLYRKNNGDSDPEAKEGEGTVDISSLPDVRYCALLQEDFAYSGFESWTEHEQPILEIPHCPHQEQAGPRLRRCKGCTALRVADADYEAVCKVPRKLARSMSCGPSSRCSAKLVGSVCGEEMLGGPIMPVDISHARGCEYEGSLEKMSSGSSVESLEKTAEAGLAAGKEDTKEDLKSDSLSPDHNTRILPAHVNRLDFTTSVVKTVEYRPVQSPRGSRLPIPVKAGSWGLKSSRSSLSTVEGAPRPSLLGNDCEFSTWTGVLYPRLQQDFHLELADLKELWEDVCDEYLPLQTQNLIEEQQNQLNQYECAAGQCVTELQKAEQQVHSLQGRIQETEMANKTLQEKLREMESELKAVRQAAQRQDRTIHGLEESLKNKENEIEELCRVVEGQNETMVQLREMVHRSQLEQLQLAAEEAGCSQPPCHQIELLDLQSSLFSSQLELQKAQGRLRHRDYELADHRRARELLETDLQEMQQQKDAAWKCCQEVSSSLQQLRAELQGKEELLKTSQSKKESEVRSLEENIQRLTQSLREKECLVQEYAQLLDCQQNIPENPEGRDLLTKKLQERIRDRDRALERALDEKFEALEEKEGEVRQLQLSLREKERDLERLRHVLSNNEETINSLEALKKGKELELEQVSATYRNLQWLKQEVEARQERSLKEKEGVIGQLQLSLQNRNQEVEDLTAALLGKFSIGANDISEELKLHLQKKERMLQEVLADRCRQAEEHKQDIQGLLQAVSSRDQQFKDTSERVMQGIRERNIEIQQLRSQLAAKDREMAQIVRESSPSFPGAATELTRLKRLLQEKERFIRELMQDSPASQTEPMTISEADASREDECEEALDLQKEADTIKEELELVLRKEKETRLEVCTLQSIIAKQSEEMEALKANLDTLNRDVHVKERLIKDLQVQLVSPAELPEVQRLTQELLVLKNEMEVMKSLRQDTADNLYRQLRSALEELILEQAELNAVLQKERQVYSSLALVHTHPDRDQTLYMELEAVRGQLEKALGRTQECVNRLEMESRGLAHFGGLGIEGDGDDRSSEFTDSIEEEEKQKQTIQAEVSQYQQGITAVHEQKDQEREAMAGVLSQNALGTEKECHEEQFRMQSEVQELTEPKVRAEEDLKMQTEDTNFSAASHIRVIVDNVEEEDLKEREGDSQSECLESEEGLREELCKLKQQLGTADTVIGLLKEQLELNVAGDGEKRFNPELIVSMAKEIERLKSELASGQGKRMAPLVELREGRAKRPRTRPHSLDLGALHSQSGDHDSPAASDCSLQPDEDQQKSGFWANVESSLREQLQQLRMDLAQCRQQNRELQDTLVVSEATVHAQAEQLKQCRVLLSEPSVEQDSKQVQVDLQDLGYETCGRSENEAERDDTSSPECEELAGDLYSETSMSEEKTPLYSFPVGPLTSSPLKHSLNIQHGMGVFGKSQDVAVLQQHIQELKAQLQKSEKVVRNLQSRMRSFSTTSDYASSMERPSKMEPGSPMEDTLSQSLLDEDEGWQSDGMGPFNSLLAPPNKDLEQLVQRVSTLEAQVQKSQLDAKVPEHLRSATWPGKYDSLIQAQARELSHLRQKMREGQGISHILTQHFCDTIKTFEELLRSNDIDYYMGQSFRDQLAQGNQLAGRITSKLSGRDHGDIDNKSGHELLALRLSKELQQKDNLIESLRSKLQKHSETPSSSHALSDSDHTDRTSFVSDDQASTNDDLEVCSDVASEYSQEDQRGRESCIQVNTDSVSHAVVASSHSSLPSSSPTTPPSQGAPLQSTPSMPCSQHHPTDTSQSEKGVYCSPVSSTVGFPLAQHFPDPPGQPTFGPQPPLLDLSYPGTSAFSLAEVQQELQMLQRQLGESAGIATPTVKPMPATNNFSGANSSSSHYIPLSHHPFHQPQLNSSGGLSETLKADTGFLNSSALWDMTHLVQPMRYNNVGDVSSGLSGYQSGTHITGTNLLEEHLGEIRRLRQRLEESIHTNDRLREQLEERLASAIRGSGPPTNIYIQGLESATQLSNENRTLSDKNSSLQARLSQMEREAEQLREALLASRARLKSVEVELGEKREESRRLQAELFQLREERKSSQEQKHRLQHEVTLLHQQLNENNQLLHTLRSELQLYERAFGSNKLHLQAYSGEAKFQNVSTSFDLNNLLPEVRNLRIQLEHSIQMNSSLRKQLEQQLERNAGKKELRPSMINLPSPSGEGGCRRKLFQDSVPSPPVRDIGMFSLSSPYPECSEPAASLASQSMEDPSLLQRQEELQRSDSMTSGSSGLEGEAPDGSFANKNGRHVISHIDDFSALKQQILEGQVLVHKMESLMQSSLNIPFLEIHGTKGLDYGTVKQLFSSADTLRLILEESTSLLKMFWRAALPSAESTAQQVKKEQLMKEDLRKLRRRITEQESLLQNTIDRLKTTNRMKENMEQFIIGQLNRTHNVLKKARGNLEKNDYQVSSINSYPCQAEIVRGQSEIASDRDFLIPPIQEVPRKRCSQRSLRRKDRRHGPCFIQVPNY